MAKRQSKNAGNQQAVILNQTISQSVTAWDSTAFAKLLEEQAQANQTAVKALESSMAVAGANQEQLAEQISQSSMMKDIRDVLMQQLNDKKIHEETEKLKKIEERKAQRLQSHIKKQTELTQQNAEATARLNRVRAEESKAIAELAAGMQTFKTIGERFADMKKGFGEKLSVRGMMKAVNVGGIFNKSIAREDFIKQQKAIDPTKSRAELTENFKGAQSASKNIKRNEAELQEFKKTTGLSDADVAKTAKGKELLSKRENLASEYSKFDVRSKLSGESSSQGNVEQKTPTAAFASVGEQQEALAESSRLMGDQTSLLVKIEENTRGGSSASGAAPAAEGSGGGLLGGLGKGLKSLGTGIGKGLGAILGGIGRGLFQLSAGLVALTPAIPVIGVLTLAAIGLGAALRLAAPAIEAFAPVLMKIAEVVGTVFVAAIEKIPEIIKSVGDVIMGVIGAISDSIIGIIDAVTGSIERLAQIDGGALLQVAGGLLALSGAMVAFGGAQALAGLGSLVGNLLTIGSDSPVEQLIKIGDRGEGIQKAADGMEKLGSAMGAFSKIDKKSMEAINDFPWLKATAFVAAGGSMQVDGAVVTKASKQNADAAAASSGGGGGNTAVVNAPVTTNNNTSQVIKSPIRNQESSMSRFIGSRYARA